MAGTGTKVDDDGKLYAVTLNEARDAILSALQGTGPSDPDRPEDEAPWISYSVDYGADRGERVLLIDITHPSGVCESFQLSITRDVLG